MSWIIFNPTGVMNHNETQVAWCYSRAVSSKICGEI